jgi:pectinesterase
MCSNALAMIKNMTDTDVANEFMTTNRKLMQEKEGNESEWPEWMSVADRRLLQSSSVAPDVVVAADGSGNYKTVSAAVAAAPKKSSKRYIIRIKAGVYRENVDVPKDKTNIMFMGDGRKTTIITASRNVVDGSTTFNSATVGESNILSPSFSNLFYLPVYSFPYFYCIFFDEMFHIDVVHCC